MRCIFPFVFLMCKPFIYTIWINIHFLLLNSSTNTFTLLIFCFNLPLPFVSRFLNKFTLSSEKQKTHLIENEASFESGNWATHEEDVCTESDLLTLTWISLSKICLRQITTPTTENQTHENPCTIINQFFLLWIVLSQFYYIMNKNLFQIILFYIPLLFYNLFGNTLQ